MKSDLNRFLEGSQLDLGVPEAVMKGVSAAIPWFLLGLLMLLVLDPTQFRSIAGGMLVVSIPFIAIGTLLPTFNPAWLNYAVYPFGTMLAIICLIILWQKFMAKKSTME